MSKVFDNDGNKEGLNSDGYTLMEGVIASALTLALSAGIGYLTYSSIIDNQKKDTVKIAAETAYAKSLEALIDFDENTTVENVLQGLNDVDDISYKLETPSDKDLVKENLCVSANMDLNSKTGEYKYTSDAGDCFGEPVVNTPKEPPVILDNIVKVSYKCDADTSGVGPINRVKTGSNDFFVLKGSDGTAIKRNINTILNLKAGIEYTITYEGAFENLSHFANDLKDCVTSIDHFGEDTKVESLTTFAGVNFVNVPAKIPSTVRNLNSAFSGASKFNDADVTEWKNNAFTNMQSTFKDATLFNQDINTWNVNGVKDVYATFNNASSFNKSLSNWKLKELKNVSAVFYGATNFNQSVNHWDVSQVENFHSAFRDASSFDKPLNNWKVNSGTNFVGTFYGASSFNQDINNWVVSSATTTNSMFRDAVKFDKPLNKWRFPELQTLNGMFYGAKAFNQPINDWGIVKATDLGSTFRSTDKFNQDLNDWKTENVTNLVSTFDEAKAFNKPLNDWKTPNVESLERTFYRAYVFNQNIDSWSLAKVSSLETTFEFAYNFNQNLDKWDTSNVSNMTRTFRGAAEFNNGDIYRGKNKPLMWETQNVTAMQAMLNGSQNAALADKPADYLPEGRNSSGSFNQNIEHWDMRNVKDLSFMFYKSSYNNTLNDLNVSNVESMYKMFQGPGDEETDSGRSPFNQNLDRWKTGNVKNMEKMFFDAHNFNRDISKWNVSNVTNWNEIFVNANALKETFKPAKFR